ncbi:hypothetical protein ACQPYE_26575 [Actinosynnema sp. CA-299493]
MWQPMLLVPAQAQASEVDAAACGYDKCLSTTNGSATLYLERLAGSQWQVCDDAKDGMRARAPVQYSLDSLTLEAVGGWGSCSSPQSLYPTPAPGTVISLKVWVQDGVSGTPRYAGYGTYTW